MPTRHPRSGSRARSESARGRNEATGQDTSPARPARGVRQRLLEDGEARPPQDRKKARGVNEKDFERRTRRPAACGDEAQRPQRVRRPALPDNVVDLEAARNARRERLEREHHEREHHEREREQAAEAYFAARERRHSRRWATETVDEVGSVEEELESTTPPPRGGAAPCHLGLFVLSLLLTVLSVPLIYSASTAVALDEYGRTNFFLMRQIPFALAGIVILIAASRISGKGLRPFVWFIYAVALIGLVATDFTPLGYVNSGVKRWLKIGPLQFQMSELAKIALIGVLADYWSRTTKASRSTWRPWFVTAVLTLPMIGLVFLQPHLSAAMLLFLIPLFVGFFAGVSWKQMGKIGVCLILLAGMAIPFLKPYQRERVVAHLNILKKDVDEQGSNYQVLQGQRALVRGGLFGTGPGGSLYKQGHLPEPHTDFIVAVIGEEWGLVGMLGLLGIYGMMIFFCFHTGHCAGNGFEAILCAGMGSLLAVQVIGNVGVVTGALPVTGMPLPLLTYGGSGMLSLLLGLGLVLSVSRRPGEGYNADGTDEVNHEDDVTPPGMPATARRGSLVSV